jgi:NAD-dependent dihydropyrimidine dehydrogenase PreA subunit
MAKKSVYAELAAALGVPGSERFIKILDATFTPDEARICHQLITPMSCPELAAKLDMGEKDLSKKLDVLLDKGAITRGRTQYGFHTNLLAFHHDSVADTAPHTGPYAITARQKELWNDFFRNEWSYTFLEHTDQMVKMTGRNLPIWPAIEALERSKNISPDDILPEENWKLKIENAQRRIIAPCGCRVVWGTCQHPVMTCFATFDRPRGVYYLNQPGRLLKEYTLAESLDIALASEAAGLVHWGDCYCCDDCCENLFPITRARRFDLMTPNRFLAVVDEDKCKGCQTCIKRCKFEAIQIKPGSSPKKQKVSIDKDKCKGCGLCILDCKQNAIRYEIVRPPEYIKGRSTSLGTGPANALPVFGFYELK